MTPRRINALFQANLDLLLQEKAYVLGKLMPRTPEPSIDDIIPL